MGSFPAKLTSKAQVTLPVEIRKSLDVGPGDRIEFFLHRTGAVSCCRAIGRQRRSSAKAQPSPGHCRARSATAWSARPSPRAAKLRGKT